MVINAFDLGETFSNKTSLTPFNRVVRTMLDFEDPFATNGLLPGRENGKGPCVGGFLGINFRLHSLLPSEIKFSFCKRTRFHSVGTMVRSLSGVNEGSGS